MANGATIDHKALHMQFGPYPFKEGRAKGDYLQVAYNADAFTEFVGIDGEGAWIANADMSARITMTFQQSAAANGILSGLHIADRLSPGGLVLPLLVKETNGSTVYSAARARIIKMADGIWSDGGAVRVWVLSTTKLRGFVGGVGATPIDPNP